MNEWKEYKLGEVVILNYGKALKEQDRKQGNIPVYSSAGITGFHDEAFVNSKGIIVGRKGTIGKVYKSEFPFCCIDTAYYILPKDDIYNFNFLYYLLQTLGLEELNSDSAVPGLNRDAAYSQDILLPPLPTQTAIAATLSSLDDKIDLLHRQNATLEKMAETLFRKWFVEEVTEEWEKGTINNLIDFNPIRRISKGTLAPFLEMAELSTTTYAPSGWYLREFSSGSKFTNGDTLLARITPCLENGKTAFVDFLEDKQIGWGSTEFITMNSKIGLHPFFAYTVARNQDFRGFAEGCMQGSSGRQRVDIDNLKTYEISIPPKETIKKFNTFCESIVPKLKANQSQIHALTALRDTLLPRLMSGEVQVKI